MKLISNLFLISLFGSIYFNSLKANEFDYYAVNATVDSFGDWGLDVYTCLNSTGICTFSKRHNHYSWSEATSYVDSANNLILDTQKEAYGGPTTEYLKYDQNSKNITPLNNWMDGYQAVYKLNTLEETSDGSETIISIGDSLKILEESKKLLVDGNTIIKKNSDGSIQIGSDGNDIDITSEGLTVDGVPLITKKDSGEIHIGKNSLITKEEDGVQKLYAKDDNGNAINIDVTNGTKLLIDGVEITPTGTIPQVITNKNNISSNKANIKNLGEGVAGSTALTAALSGLPQTSKETKLSCGVGTGAYSSRYAVGFGCASKVNERVDVNAGGSYVFGGSKSYGGGTLDSGVVKAGFVFKLGELNQSTQISMKEKKEFKKEISILKENNEKIISQNKALLSRLERLEKIALIGTKSKDLEVYKLK